MSHVQRGEVYMVKPDPSIGKEQKNKRPCVVVSSNIVNSTAGLIVVCPVTEGLGLQADIIHISLNKGEGGLTKDSIILCDQIKAVDETRIIEKLGNLSGGIMQKIDTALCDILNLHKN
ncbi:MAG: type II toxin-antitoxin system PemK/MazF family toxin [Bacteroidota bacterium]